MIVFKCDECFIEGRFAIMEKHREKMGHKIKKMRDSGLGCDLCMKTGNREGTFCKECGGTYCPTCFSQHFCEVQKP